MELFEKRNILRGEVMIRVVLVYMLLPVVLLSAVSPLEEGERLLMDNRPGEALLLLEEALESDPENERILLYLGVVYEQLGRREEAIRILKRGLDVAGAHRYLLYYNIGNNHYAVGENIVAEEMYTRAIAENRDFALSYLNRANARLRLEDYRGALSDYTLYLRIAPRAPQRREVERMIAKLRAYLDERERREKERLEKERALMDEVLRALENASEGSKNLSTESDEVLSGDEDEIDIEE